MKDQRHLAGVRELQRQHDAKVMRRFRIGFVGRDRSDRDVSDRSPLASDGEDYMDPREILLESLPWLLMVG
jgi:hypothetical protein